MCRHDCCDTMRFARVGWGCRNRTRRHSPGRCPSIRRCRNPEKRNPRRSSQADTFPANARSCGPRRCRWRKVPPERMGKWERQNRRQSAKIRQTSQCPLTFAEDLCAAKSQVVRASPKASRKYFAFNFPDDRLIGTSGGCLVDEPLQNQLLPAFLDQVELIRTHIMKDLAPPARPSNLHALRLRRFAQTEMQTEIAL